MPIRWNGEDVNTVADAAKFFPLRGAPDRARKEEERHMRPAVVDALSDSDVIAAVDGLLRDLERIPLGVSDSIRAEITFLAGRARDEGGSLSLTERRELLHQLIRICVESDLQVLLSQNNISFPVYNFLRGFQENAPGPWDGEPDPPELSGPMAWRVLDTELRSPIGVPASVLTANHRWIRYFSKRGFNVITAQTVRSVEYEAHTFPHWVFLEESDTPWTTGEQAQTVFGNIKTWPKNFRAFSTANSLGVPSFHPDVWKANFQRSLAVLRPGQILILSVIGTSGLADRSLVEDFVVVAQHAVDAGAEFIELNLSCPNTVDTRGVGGVQRPVCESPDVTCQIIQAVREAVDAKLVAKLSYLKPGLLEDVVGPILPLVDAISGINTVQKSVVDPGSGAPLFRGTAADPEAVRDTAGVSGTLIRDLGLEFVQGVRRLCGERSSVEIIGIGGVMSGDDYALYREAGADAVQAATGALINTRLPLEALDVEPVPRTRSDTSRWETLRRGVASGGLSLITGYSS